MDAVADVQPGQVDEDAFRNRIRPAPHLDRVTDDVEHAAALDAGAFLVVFEHHLDVDVEPGGFAEAHEIDMDGAVGDRVHLQVAGQHPVFFAADLDLEHAGEEAGAPDLVQQVQGVDGNQHRFFLVAVNHARNPAGAADRPGRALAGALAQFGGECRCLGHVMKLLGFRLSRGRGYIPFPALGVNQ